MDDIKTIDFDFDSSFIIGLEGQKRNYDLFYYHPDDLFIDQGEVKAKGFFFNCQKKHIKNTKKHPKGLKNEWKNTFFYNKYPFFNFLLCGSQECKRAAF